MPSSGIGLRLRFMRHPCLPELPNLGKKREEDKLCFLSLAGKRRLFVAGVHRQGVAERLIEANKKGKQFEANGD